MSLVASLALLATNGPASAAPKRITGKLSKPGYTVVALATSGKAQVVRAGRRAFRLRPPSSRVRLHLRAPNGKYAGPIVVATRKRGRRAVIGVRAGARLGRINVRRGHGRVARRVGSRWIDAKRIARARRGVPIGAGNFGRVRSRPARRSPPGDLDADGVPDVLDIDDDGDRVLDKLDRSRRAGAAQTTQDPFALSSLLSLPLELTRNVHAGLSAEIDEAVRQGPFGFLLMQVPEADLVELDCGGEPDPLDPNGWIGGLIYCTRGGTGRIEPNRPDVDRFPECCDPDGNGDGNLHATQRLDGFGLFKLIHHATESGIGTGDELHLRITDNGQQTTLTDMHQFVFVTVPALKEFVDEAGQRTVVSYPVPRGAPGTSSPGTAPNGFPVGDGPDGDSDVEVTVTLWRPQRRAIPPETDDWWDIGGLDHTVMSGEASQLPTVSPRDPGWCPQTAFATSDPNLTPGFPSGVGGTGGFRDGAPDQPADPGNTFTYTLNLSECLRRYGLSFDPGQTRTFGFQAFSAPQNTDSGTSGADNASTSVAFTRR